MRWHPKPYCVKPVFCGLICLLILHCGEYTANQSPSTTTGTFHQRPDFDHISTCRQQKNRLAGKMRKRILWIDYNPVFPDGQTARDIQGLDKSRDEIQYHIDYFYQASCGRLIFDIVAQEKHQNIPRKDDGFQYTLKHWKDVITGKVEPHRTDIADYNQIIRENHICERANRGEIDEVFLTGAAWFGFYESAMIAGPQSKKPFDINGRVYMSSCNKLVPIGIVGGHTFGHRAENTISFLFNGYKDNYLYDGKTQNTRKNEYEDYFLNRGQSRHFQQFGCGTIHYPPNSRCDPQYRNCGDVPANLSSYKDEIQSYCDDFLNYPKVTRKTRTINCDAWGCNDEGYYFWWFNHLPGYVGNEGHYIYDWWRYIFDVNYTADFPEIASHRKF